MAKFNFRISSKYEGLSILYKPFFGFFLFMPVISADLEDPVKKNIRKFHDALHQQDPLKVNYYLVEKKVDPNSSCEILRPLSVAVIHYMLAIADRHQGLVYRNVKIIGMLLGHGADPLLFDKDGEKTPLAYAVTDLELFEVLLDYVPVQKLQNPELINHIYQFASHYGDKRNKRGDVEWLILTTIARRTGRC